MLYLFYVRYHVAVVLVAKQNNMNLLPNEVNFKDHIFNVNFIKNLNF